MKYLILFSALLFNSCYEVERNCDQFKTGTFESTISLLVESEYKSTFTRTSDLQVEEF